MKRALITRVFGQGRRQATPPGWTGHYNHPIYEQGDEFWVQVISYSYISEIFPQSHFLRLLSFLLSFFLLSPLSLSLFHFHWRVEYWGEYISVMLSGRKSSWWLSSRNVTTAPQLAAIPGCSQKVHTRSKDSDPKTNNWVYIWLIYSRCFA